MRSVAIMIILVYICLKGNALTHVLTVSVGSYPPESGWSNINADNDRDLLVKTFGDVAELKILNGREATRSAIMAAFRTLENDAHSGDTIIAHFSCHGQQIVALNKANEPDGLDEAIVPYDAYKDKTPEYDGYNHIRDDEFGQLLTKLREKVGPRGLVLSVVDACHSDSMDKAGKESEDIVRGTYDIFGIEDKDIELIRSRYRNQETAPLTTSNKMAPLVLMSACRTDRQNHEIKIDGKGFGSLTYYFVKAYRHNHLDDVVAFVDDVYCMMSEDKTLAFYGQKPVIRNTLGWTEPSEIDVPDLSASVPFGESGHSNWYMIAMAFAAVTVVCIYLWKRKRRN